MSAESEEIEAKAYNREEWTYVFHEGSQGS
jgi:hypothetical protein